jgi:hypothetical protein
VQTHRAPFPGYLLLFLFWVSLASSAAKAQSTYTLDTLAGPPADTVNRFSQRLPWLAAGGTALYGGGLLLLNQAWYQDKPQTNFHWFDDAREWKQMDKVGHFWGSFHESRLGVDLLRKAGVPQKKAIWYGGALGFLLQTPIEYFDGRSPDYGASLSDIAANAAGSLGVIAQQLSWGELRLQPKFSFHRTRYAPLRPNVLGKGPSEEFLKDYNGQTYWLSVDLAKFLAPRSKFPKWLNPTLGLGAEEMVFNDPDANRAMGFDAYRQYYLSVDLNWQAIPTRSKFLKSAFYVLSIFKFPAPALEYSKRKGLRAHALYY